MYLLLKRKPLSEKPSVDFDEELHKTRAELYEKSEKLLSWSPKVTPQRPDRLRNVLRELDIHPFTWHSVVAYQAAKVYRPPLGAVIRGCLALVCGALAVRLWMACYAARDGFYLGAMAIAMTGATLFMIARTAIRYRETKRMWQCRNIASLRNYSSSTANINIPDFVLATAVRVKEACPAATLSVEYLEERRNHIELFDPDPFLVASLGQEEFYLEVWDERDYKEEREAA